MLPVNAVQTVVPLAKQLAANGVYLMATPNTPLAALTKESSPVGYSDVTPNISPEQMQDYLIGNSIDNILYRSTSEMPGTAIIPHNKVMDDIVPVIAEAVRKQINFARNVVVPVVEELAVKVKERVENFSTSALSEVEVVVFHQPLPLANAIMQNSLEQYKDVNYDPSIRLSTMLPEKDIAEIKELMNTNANDLDKDIAVWLNEQGDAFVSGLWQDFFMGKGSLNIHEYISSTGSFFGRSNININILLGIHLLARRLFDNPPEGTDLDLNRYNELIAQVRDSSGARLYIEFTGYAEEVSKNKVLVRSLTPKQVIVNEDVYREWINMGGDNDILFGLLLTNNAARTMDAVMSIKDALLSSWNRHTAIVSTTEANQRYLKFKDILLSSYREILLHIEDSSVNKEDLYNKFRDQTETVTSEDFNNLYLVCLRLVCRSQFKDSDAEKILLSVNQISLENPKLSVREAAAIASIKYIAEWVATEQFKVFE